MMRMTGMTSLLSVMAKLKRLPSRQRLIRVGGQ